MSLGVPIPNEKFHYKVYSTRYLRRTKVDIVAKYRMSNFSSIWCSIRVLLECTTYLALGDLNVKPSFKKLQKLKCFK